MTNTTQTKEPKVATTNRIRVKATERHRGTIYVSSMIASEIKDFVIRGNQNVLMAKKDMYYDLGEKLRELLRKHPNHFMKSSRAYVENIWGK